MARCHDGGVLLQLCGGTCRAVRRDTIMEKYTSNFKEAHAKQGCVESMIESIHAADLSIEEYQDRFVVKGFSHKEGVQLVEAFASVVGGFKIHEQDTHDCRLKKSQYALMNAPRAWNFKIDELLPMLGFSKICADLCLVSS
jgi:hypothetical protein